MSETQEILAKIRTLLALERNFLAKERTALAEFRTGLAIALVAPAASTILAYFSFLFEAISLVAPAASTIFTYFSFLFENILIFDALIIVIFIVLFLTGLRICLKARSKLKNIRKRINILDDRIKILIKNSGDTYSIMADLFAN